MLRLSQDNPLEVDCVVLGAGITGAGVARDAALRGLSTVVIDSNDFASGTSHLSSKLVHGGFRYLEHFHLRLVWEGIVERERLMTRVAPHLLRPLKFVLPFRKNQGLKWLLAVGVSHLYGLPLWWHSGRRSDAYWGGRFKRSYPHFCGPPRGISFWDAQTNDARLVLAALRSAEQEGAMLLNYTRVTHATFDGRAWNLVLRGESQPWEHVVRAKAVVNATGPWSALTALLLDGEPSETHWVKGSHILLRRPASFGDDAIIIRSVRGGRPLWAVPWENRLMVGSTETTYAGDLRDVRPTRDEVSDLFLSVVEAFPDLALNWEDIRCAYAGVRPIAHQAPCEENRMSRRHSIQVESARRLITVSGGKLTTFRRMGEQAVDQLDRLLGRPKVSRVLRRSLRGTPLWPGLRRSEIEDLRHRLTRRIWQIGLDSGVVDHWIRFYGIGSEVISELVIRSPQWGQALADGLPYTLAELAYLCQTEKVQHLVDLVKRRTPLYFLVDECGLAWLPGVVEQLAPILGWDRSRCDAEISALVEEINGDLESLGRRVVEVPTLDSLVA